MKMPGFLARRREMRTEIEGYRATIHAMSDILSSRAFLQAFPDAASATGGNRYRTYAAQVTQLVKMFNGGAQWGNQLLENVVKVRAAFTLGGGVVPVPTAGAKERLKEMRETDEQASLPELEFIRDFMSYNDLDRECAQDFAAEGELEGKVLLTLTWDERDRMPSVRHVAWTAARYAVETAENDYRFLVRAKWENESGKGSLETPEFVYLKFGGRTSAVNDTPPRLGKLITDLEDLDKALADWRAINKLYSAPTPYMKCASEDEVKKVLALVQSANWKIGKFLAGTGEFSLVGYEGQGVDSLEKEITFKVKVVSGGSGVPVHFLGLPDLLSNRATADNLMDLAYTSTQRERQVWQGGYTELFRKAIAMRNARTPGQPLDPEAVEASIPSVTREQIQQLADIWLPIYAGGGMSLEAFLSRVPGVDPDEEMKRIAEDEERKAHSILSRLPVLPEDRDVAPGSVGLGAAAGNGNGGGA